MKLFKSLMFYCIAIIFIISLTSSFGFKIVEDGGALDLGLDSQTMYQVFYGGDYEEKEAADGKVDNTEENQAEEESQDITIVTEYELGDSGEEVFKYQKILYYLDYLDGNLDGNFGEQVKLSVEEYQKDKEIEVTGKLDASTQKLLLQEDIEYKPGKSGDEIKEYQMVLYYLDYLQSYPEGEFGSATETAVKKYQQDKSLEVTGIIDVKTQESLKGEKLEYKVGKKGEDIKEYQSILIELGYLSGSPDGHLGNMTSNAIKEYQKNNKLEETGYLDSPTQEALKRPLSEQVDF